MEVSPMIGMNSESKVRVASRISVKKKTICSFHPGLMLVKMQLIETSK
jgi:hypothetical protein